LYRVASFKDILDMLSYDYVEIVEDRSEPERADLTFADLIPRFKGASGRAGEISGSKLYKHQLEALNALKEGFNVILISGTGSGKTEAWVLYALLKSLRVLAVYPTLALSEDQVDRLKSYYNTLGFKNAVVKIDSNVVRRSSSADLRDSIGKAQIIVTNPAFLMADFKRFRRDKSWLKSFLLNVDLIVLDELDYYGSGKASLLLALIDIICRAMGRKPQVMVLTATLGNPDELRSYLTKVNGRKTRIIEGRAFKVENRVYLIRGKNLTGLWGVFRKNRDRILRSYPELRDLVDDPSKFKENISTVMYVTRSLGLEMPKFEVDVGELLLEYARRQEDIVTVVFTPSIKVAETLARKLIEGLVRKLKLDPDIARSIVCVHHHLVSSSERLQCEEKARRGEVKFIFTVRTLLQGIDIGRIARIVHYGLPEDLREFKQREGRKGRRREIPYSETIIIPLKGWDRRLVDLGDKGLRELINMPLEKIYINPDHGYIRLFKALAKLMRITRENLEDYEMKLLENLGLVKLVGGTMLGGVNWEGIGKVWKHINFYTYGPPFGVPRYLERPNGTLEPLEEVAMVDLVEKFQPGSFDYSEDAIVKRVERIDRRGGKRRVVEVELGYVEKQISITRCLSEALSEYEYIKRRWDEVPDLVGDFRGGRLTSTVQLSLEIPRGFGPLKVRPVSTVWRVESRKPKVVRRGDEILVYHEHATIPVECGVRGSHTDYTYAIVRELDPDEDLGSINVGLAVLKLALRFSDYRLSFNELKYFLDHFPRKVFALVESSSSGILESIDWSVVRKTLDTLNYGRLHEILLEAVDEEAVHTAIARGLSWDDMRRLAHKVIDYIEELVRVKIEGLDVVAVKAPSPDLKLLALSILELDLGRNGRCYVISTFDGGKFEDHIAGSPGNRLCGESGEIEKLLRNLVQDAYDRGYSILVYAQLDKLKELGKGSKSLARTIQDMEDKKTILDVHDEVKRALGVDIAPLELLEQNIKIKVEGTGIKVERGVKLEELKQSWYEVRVELTKTGSADIQEKLKKLLEQAREYAKTDAYMTYVLHLVADKILQEKESEVGEQITQTTMGEAEEQA